MADAVAGAKVDVAGEPSSDGRALKPRALVPVFERVPRELRRHARFVLWRYEVAPGKNLGKGGWTKVPYRADGRGRASTTKDATWATFEAVRAAFDSRVHEADGIGWVIGERVVGGDIDACRDPVSGTLTHEAERILREAGTYAEVSPSGTGVRYFAFGELPPKGRKRGNVEMYDGDGGRYLTVTGHQLDGTPDTIEHRTTELAAIHARHIARPERPKASANGAPASGRGRRVSDVNVLEAMKRNRRNGAELARLYDGDTSAYGGDHSAADMALVGALVWWCNGDADQVDRLFRASRLMRDKWDRPARQGETYGEGTIREALEGHEIGTGYQGLPQRYPAELGSPPRDETDPGPAPSEADATPKVSATSLEPRGIRDPAMTPELAETLASFKNTDLGNGERLAYLFGDYLRFAPGLGWYVWDGLRWVLDDTGEVHRLAARTVRLLYRALPELPVDSDKRGRLAKHAARSESRRALDATVESARRGQSIRSLTVTADQLDADPDLLNVLNGTLHLPSGRLQPHDPRDLITKLAPVPYDPDAQAPMWEAFQHFIADGDADLMAYKHRAFGYTITGHTTEQALFIPYGLGSNGKSTELESIAVVIGDNAMTAAYNTFASMRDGSAQRFGLARLAGARFVRASEGEQGARLAEGTVKLVTGGERVPAEFKGRDVFEYTPRFKLWLATNHRPETRGTDHGLWRRIKLIPYARTITDEERDPAFAAKLRSELPGILAWLVRGARKWYRLGLGTCGAVDDATKAYRDDMDILGPFLSALVRQDDPLAFEGSARLYAAYAEWMRANYDDPITQTAFGRALTERGLRKRHTRSGNVYDGMKLTQDGEAHADRYADRKSGHRGGEV